MIFSLIQDFADALAVMPTAHPRQRILSLLGEALRRDVHFIDRHPTTLFQYLWNTCWWYDCPEAARHYVANNKIERLHQENRRFWPWMAYAIGLLLVGSLLVWTGYAWSIGCGAYFLLVGVFCFVVLLKRPRFKTEPIPAYVNEPTGRGAVRLWVLLEHWRSRRAAAGGAWLRSLRPPPVHLGSSQLHLLSGHESYVSAVQFAPDGRRLVSGSFDRTIRIWDVADGRCLLVCRHPDGEIGVVRAACFSPDGRSIAHNLGSEVYVRSADNGAVLHHWLGHKSEVYGLAFSPNGEFLASASVAANAKVWSLATGREVSEIQGAKGTAFLAISYSPDGNRLALASNDGAVRLWDLEHGRFTVCLMGHQDIVTCVAFSSNGKFFATGSYDKSVRLWDAATGQALCCLDRLNQWVTGVCFSPDSQKIISCGYNCLISIWQIGALPATSYLANCLSGHEGVISGVHFSPDGKLIASASYDRTIRMWQHRTGQDEPLGFRWPESGARDLVLAPNRRQFATSHFGGTILMWDIESAKQRAALDGRSGDVACLCFSRDSKLLASATKDRKVHIWEADTGREVHCFRDVEESVKQPSSDGSGAKELLFSHDGSLLACRNDDSVFVWTVESGRLALAMDLHVVDLRFGPDGKNILMTHRQGIRVVDVASAQVVCDMPPHAGLDAPRESIAAPGQSLRPDFRWESRFNEAPETCILDPGGAPIGWLPHGFRKVAPKEGLAAWIGFTDAHVFCYALDGCTEGESDL